MTNFSHSCLAESLKVTIKATWSLQGNYPLPEPMAARVTMHVFPVVPAFGVLWIRFDAVRRRLHPFMSSSSNFEQ